jgi:hypothetical protein
MNAASETSPNHLQAPSRPPRGLLQLLRRLPWPYLSFGIGGYGVQLNGPFPFEGDFMAGVPHTTSCEGLDAIARWDQQSAWFWVREAGSVEMAAGHYRLTVCWTPVRKSKAPSI